MVAPQISVVVPVLNEETRIADQLADLTARSDLSQIVVVDGGSRDRTADDLRGFPTVELLASPPGRGIQMNRGAEIATGDVFLFLHADVRLPFDAGHLIRESLAAPGIVGGAFRTRTVADANSRWHRRLLEPLLRLADLRSRFTSVPYGDQALFVRADVFRQAGGFPEIPIMEDVELSRRLRRLGRLDRLPASVTVSGRRFVARPIRSALMMRSLPWLFRLGVPPSFLARLYGQIR